MISRISFSGTTPKAHRCRSLNVLDAEKSEYPDRVQTAPTAPELGKARFAADELLLLLP